MQIEQVISGARDALTVKRVYGDPIEKDGVTIIPAAVVRGAAGGGGEAKNEGSGFALTAKPAGALIVKGDKVRYRPAVDVNRVILGGQIVAAIALLSIRSILRARMARPLLGMSMRPRRLARRRLMLALRR